jgi:hypothetical protein
MKPVKMFVMFGAIAFHFPEFANAQDAMEYEAVRNQVSCYPFGIDKIGQGKVEEGNAIWKTCFTPDFKFKIYLGYGQPIVCPGDKGELPGMNSIEKRAAFAKAAFDRAKFVKTSHHLTNVAIAFKSPDRASVKAYVQAWHWREDGSGVVAPGEWDVELSKTTDGWRISEENLSIVGAGVIQPPK